MHVQARERSWHGLEELRPVLKGYLSRRCRDENEADDVVQETLMRAARYRASLTETARLRSWAVRIAANVLSDHVRRECRLQRAAGGEELLEELEDTGGPADDEVEGDLRCGNWTVGPDGARDCLDGALSGMREDDRLLLRSFYGGLGSCRATAAECRIPAALVKVRLFRARQRLQRAVRRRLSLGAGRPVAERERVH